MIAIIGTSKPVDVNDFVSADLKRMGIIPVRVSDSNTEIKHMGHKYNVAINTLINKKEISQNDLILFLDDTVKPIDPQFYQKFVTVMDRRDIGVCGVVGFSGTTVVGHLMYNGSELGTDTVGFFPDCDIVNSLCFCVKAKYFFSGFRFYENDAMMSDLCNVARGDGDRVVVADILISHANESVHLRKYEETRVEHNVDMSSIVSVTV